MRIRDPKAKRYLILSSVVYLFILLYEIFPACYTLGDNIFSAVLKSFNGNTDEDLLNKLNQKKNEYQRLINIFNGDSSGNNLRLSSTLDKLNITAEELDISLISIKPVKSTQNGKLINQRMELYFKSDYENIYNYFRWLFIKGVPLDIISMNITREKEETNLILCLVIDIISRESSVK